MSLQGVPHVSIQSKAISTEPRRLNLEGTLINPRSTIQRKKAPDRVGRKLRQRLATQGGDGTSQSWALGLRRIYT